MRYFSLLILLIIFQTGFSQKITEKSLLWEISGNGLKHKSYLFGSSEFNCVGNEKIDEKLLKIFDKTEVLLTTIDKNSPDFETNFFSTFLITDGTNLTDKLDETTINILKGRFDDESVNFRLMLHLRPQFFLLQMDQFSFDCQVTAGNELILIQKAKEEEKEIFGLNTFKDETDLIFSISEKDALEAIAFHTANFEDFKIYNQQLYQAYQNAAIQKLYDLVIENQKNSIYLPYDIKKILDEKNSKWFPDIEIHIKQKPTFILLDAVYLAGENGLINKLKRKGYTVKAIQ